MLLHPTVTARLPNDKQSTEDTHTLLASSLSEPPHSASIPPSADDIVTLLVIQWCGPLHFTVICWSSALATNSAIFPADDTEVDRLPTEASWWNNYYRQTVAKFDATHILDFGPCFIPRRRHTWPHRRHNNLVLPHRYGEFPLNFGLDPVPFRSSRNLLCSTLYISILVIYRTYLKIPHNVSSL